MKHSVWANLKNLVSIFGTCCQQCLQRVCCVVCIGVERMRTTQKSPLNSSEILSKNIKMFFHSFSSFSFLRWNSNWNIQSSLCFPHVWGNRDTHRAAVCSSLPAPHCAPCSPAHHLFRAGRTSCYGLWMWCRAWGSTLRPSRNGEAVRNHCCHLLWAAPWMELASGRTKSKRNCCSQPRKKCSEQRSDKEPRFES